MICIEHGRPRSVLRELPDRWAQTCITGPPADEQWSLPALSVVIDELHRVTRRDGTLLWNVERPQPLPLRRLVFEFLISGWHLQRSALASSSGYLLFAKRCDFHWHPPAVPRARRLQRAGCITAGSVWWSRRAGCVPAPSPEPAADVCAPRLERLLLAATGRTACGACGAPRGQAERRLQRRAPGVLLACGHLRPDGRCLVIDPYQQPDSPLPALAVRHGCSYLGVQPPVLEQP